MDRPFDRPMAAGRPKSALERAQNDLSAGRPDLARDRLTGYLYTLHRRGKYEQQAYILLGDACYAMKDYARAGAAWLLTERQGEDAGLALKAFHERFGTDATNILNVVKPHAPSEDYPPLVQERLKSWSYRYRPYRPRSNPHASEELGEHKRQQGVRPVELGCALAVLVLVALGIYTLWLWLGH